MHEVQAGPASQSYGLQVAQLAGVPKSVIQKAKTKLIQLEEESQASPHRPSTVNKGKAEQPLQSDLFIAPVPSESDQRLDEINPDELTPREALDILYELKALSSKR
jgi:DNA mismatch repair protein MutS